MSSISKTDRCMERSILALLSAYQEYLFIFQLKSEGVQRVRSLSARICVAGVQRVNNLELI